tara:strand:- start:39284 stop:40477 length:1194 start_codon:yes stop_codon:yes gene_type:complete
MRPKDNHETGALARAALAGGYGEDPADWEGEDPPRREWILEGCIPCGKATALYGDGGTGKTLLAVQLAVGCATGRKFLGEQVKPCRVYAFLAENEKADTHQALMDICRAEGLALGDLRGRLRIASRAGEDNHFVDYNASAQDSEVWTRAEKEIHYFRPELIIIDPLSEVFWGNENDRGQVTDFVRRFGTKLALRTGAAVLLLAHPSKSGRKDGTSGSTAWSNAVRSRLFLRDDDDDENVRILSVEKSNLAPRGKTISMRWSSGVFFRETQYEAQDRDEELTARIIQFVADEYERGQHWSPHVQAKNWHVSKRLAHELRQSEENIQRLVNAAMQSGKLHFEQVDAHHKKNALMTAAQKGNLAVSLKRRKKTLKAVQYIEKKEKNRRGRKRGETAKQQR